MLRDPEKSIGKLIDSQKISFISSVDEQGYPNMKAMLSPRKRIGLKSFYFTTNTSSQRVAQYRACPKASIYFYKRWFIYRGVMLTGTMEVLEDKEAKELIWQNGDIKYYPLGVTDPDYCVLKFTAEKGRYYCKYNSEDFNIED